MLHSTTEPLDAPPFGQLMDIPAEAASFDPDGEFVRRWLPVLARMPTQHVHAPWTAAQVRCCLKLPIR
jgi:deoxyribodipyrimidine photo-lyase